MALPALIETTVERRLKNLANFKRTIDDLFDPHADQPTLSYGWLRWLVIKQWVPVVHI